MEVKTSRACEIKVGQHVTFSLDHEFAKRHRFLKAKNMLLIPHGRRFRGRIKSFFHGEHNYGIIQSSDVFHRFGFGHDVILYAKELQKERPIPKGSSSLDLTASFSIDQEVAFAVSLDMQGRPKAIGVVPLQVQFLDSIQHISQT